ncbi:MAG: hypothetical protein EB084_13390 [Proteobacteria bacterium]|nr:hypothetical protein [Pseudomonadota bacterium]
MTRNTLRTAALVLTLMLTMIPMARAEGGDPAKACQAFWADLAEKRYGDAWDALTEGSKGWIVSETAKAGKVSKEEVRALFDKHNEEVLNAFWNAFCEKMNPESIASLTYKAGPVQGDKCKVEVTGGDASKPIGLEMLREGGQWHFGLAETFMK